MWSNRNLDAGASWVAGHRRAVCTRLMAFVMTLLLAACQPVDELGSAPRQTSAAPAERPIDAPVVVMPQRLDALWTRVEPVVLEWQEDPQVAELLVEFDGEQHWRRVQLTYVAADADRFLTVVVTPETVTDERTTLATLGLRPITRRGMTSLPPFPAQAREPGDLADSARAALRRCAMPGRVLRVLYASGAPVSWGGRRWTAPPEWTATVTTARGSVSVNPETGVIGDCIEA